jgi:hypothetical protein
MCLVTLKQTFASRAAFNYLAKTIVVDQREKDAASGLIDCRLARKYERNQLYLTSVR